MLLILFLLASASALAVPKKHVVFLLDRSRSMQGPCGKGRIRDVQRVASGMLHCIRDDGNVLLSFYRFGEKDRHQAILDGVSPREALERLPELFTTDCDQYRDQWTFIAYSTFQILKHLVQRPDLQPSDPLPDEAAMFSFYVFTDGDEDTPHFNNRPYETWLASQRRQNRITLWLWNITHKANAPCPSGNRVQYLVQVGSTIPPDAARVDPEQARPSEPLPVQVGRRIVLFARDVVSPEDQEDPRLCRGEPSQGDPTPLPDSALRVQAVTEWGLERASGATPEWTIRAPGRGLLPDGAIDRSSLELEILGDASGRTEVVVPSVQIPDGQYPIRLDRSQLCRELKRVYPFSDFLLPEEPPEDPEGSGGGLGPLPRLGHVLVERHPTHVFSLETQNGVPADLALPGLVADRFHRYSSVSRTFRLVPPDGVAAGADWSIQVDRDGAPLADASDVASLSRDPGARGTSISAPVGEDVVLAVPAKDQHPLWSLLGSGFHRPPGTYVLRLCVQPRLPAGDTHAIRVDCRACGPGSLTRDEEAWCVPIPVQVQGRPLSWIALTLIALAILVALRIAWRWKTRPRFPRGLRIGHPLGGEDLRSAHEKGLSGILALYFRRPLYLDLQSDGSTGSWRRLPASKGKPVSMNLLGVRPSPHGGQAIWCWCAALECDEEGLPAAEVRVDGAPLEPLAREPGIGETTGLIPVDLRDVEVDRKVVTLFRRATNRVVEFPIRLEEH